jgi:site-specific DNA recombinase
VILESVLQAMDEVHSLMSREKGLAGMAENVRRGFRAGGRAPLGYTLATIETGTVRDGAAVTKSRLQPSDDATKIGAFLRDRAAGMPRAQAAKRAGLEVAVTSLIGMEWNALTYAGHTVWNVHAERVKGGYKGGRKRRPRVDWVLTRDTHPALIAERDAERILARLEAVSATRARPGKRTYVLAGLVGWQGTPWHGDSGNYRYGKGRKIEAERLERAVLARLGEDLQGKTMVRELTERIRASYAAEQDPGEGRKLDREIAELTRRIERLGQLLAETTAPQALLRSIEAWEATRAKLQAQRDGLAAAAEIARAARAVREADVRQVLTRMAEDLAQATGETLKMVVGRFIGAIDLDPVSYACTIKYRVETGDKLASPRGFALIPHLPEFESRLQLEPNRTWRRAA